MKLKEKRKMTKEEMRKIAEEAWLSVDGVDDGRTMKQRIEDTYYPHADEIFHLLFALREIAYSDNQKSYQEILKEEKEKDSPIPECYILYYTGANGESLSASYDVLQEAIFHAEKYVLSQLSPTKRSAEALVKGHSGNLIRRVRKSIVDY